MAKRYIAKSYGVLMPEDEQNLRSASSKNNNFKKLGQIVRAIYLIIGVSWIPGFYKLYQSHPNSYTLTLFISWTIGVLLALVALRLFPDGERITELSLQENSFTIFSSDGEIKIDSTNSQIKHSFIFNIIKFSPFISIYINRKHYSLRPCPELDVSLKTYRNMKNMNLISILIRSFGLASFLVSVISLYLLLQSIVASVY